MTPCKTQHTSFLSHLCTVADSCFLVPSMQSLRVLCCILTFALSSSVSAQLQEREPVVWRIGVFGSYGLNFHQAFLDSIPGIAKAIPPFRDGRGMGFNLGVLFEKPLSHQFSLGGRFSLTSLNGAMLTTDSLYTSSITPTGLQLIRSDIEYQADVNVNVFSLEPLAAWHPFPNASLYVGGRIGFGIGTFSQKRTIINDPTGLSRLPDSNGQATSNTSDVVIPVGNIPNIFFPHLSALVGLSYAIPLDIDETFFLAPEIWYAYNFTPVVNSLAPGQAWTINSLRGGVSLRYSPEAARRYLPPAIVRTAESSRLSINITPLALDSNGGESPLLRLRVEETLSRQMHPLLPAIFFDKNSDVLAARYLRLLGAQIPTFSEKTLAKWGTLEIYYHVLNILGKRLRENPSANIRLVGCVSADEITADSAHITLATHRAEAVMTYLRDVWRIPTERIQIEVRGLPVEASTLPLEAAQVENRRVEVYSDAWNVIRPVIFADTLMESTPPAIKFLLRVNTQGHITKWRFKIDQAKQVIQAQSGLGTPDSAIYWHPSREHRTIPRTEDVIRCNFDVLETEGDGGTATISIPIEQVSLAKKRRKITLDGTSDADKSIEVYRFINFAPESAQLKQAHERIITELTQTRIDAKAKVFVTGYTDKLGNPTQNLRLSADRANAIAQMLTQTISAGNHVPTPVVAGLGSTLGIYAETTPEGRLYSRMVEIRIETPSSGR